MPSPRPSKKQALKKELEARLGEPVLTRKEAAERLGTTAATLNAEPNDWPPYYSQGPRKVALYPASRIEEFVAKGRVASRREKGKAWGCQQWPPAPPAAPSNKEEVLRMFAGDDEEYLKTLRGE